jgi:hypothetical protein
VLLKEQFAALSSNVTIVAAASAVGKLNLRSVHSIDAIKLGVNGTYGFGWHEPSLYVTDLHCTESHPRGAQGKSGWRP